MKNRKAIVTLAVGETYENLFERTCRPSWEPYSEKYAYDLIVVKNMLDQSERARRRSPAWQKLLILSQDWSRKYDQIVWIDTDVIINNATALDIADGVPPEKVGAVDSGAIPNREWHDIGISRLFKAWEEAGINFLDNRTPGAYYENRGISGGRDLDAVMQTGVFVCSPAHHKEIFEHIYHSYEDSHGPAWNYEMPAMSYELVKHDLVHWITPRFNFVVAALNATLYPFHLERALKGSFLARLKNRVMRKFGPVVSKDEMLSLLNIYELGYFMHFAGCSNLMEPFCNFLRQRDSKVPVSASPPSTSGQRLRFDLE